jgi:hypothetical protein
MNLFYFLFFIFFLKYICITANFYALAKRSANDFLTPRGRRTKDFIYSAIDKLQLNVTLGCSPLTFSPDTDYADPDSLYHLYVNKIIPSEVPKN